mmetsp:Transcript_23384/g.54676  ORF Transcript_23384/g.54676 Transcript_23384/m.54676 type:complete len:218 (-) Transcript_23384:167-820(-)
MPCQDCLVLLLWQHVLPHLHATPELAAAVDGAERRLPKATRIGPHGHAPANGRPCAPELRRIVLPRTNGAGHAVHAAARQAGARRKMPPIIVAVGVALVVAESRHVSIHEGASSVEPRKAVIADRWECTRRHGLLCTLLQLVDLLFQLSQLILSVLYLLTEVAWWLNLWLQWLWHLLHRATPAHLLLLLLLGASLGAQAPPTPPKQWCKGLVSGTLP